MHEAIVAGDGVDSRPMLLMTMCELSWPTGAVRRNLNTEYVLSVSEDSCTSLGARGDTGEWDMVLVRKKERVE